jgi:hypothetical protein
MAALLLLLGLTIIEGAYQHTLKYLGVDKNGKPVSNGPYRTAAEIPLDPEPIKQPKPKREWKMPRIELGKRTKTFGYLLPVCASVVGIGLTYDTPVIGIGLKWGLATALALVAAFFACLTVAHADHGS